MTNEKSVSRARKTKVKKRRRRLLLLLPLVLLIGFIAVYGTYLYNKADEAISGSYEDDGREKSALRDSGVDPTKDHVSVLFIGVDDSEKRAAEGQSRSDALMLATLNNDEKSVKLLSIPRDTYAYIPEVDHNTKINHAHAYGGAPATIGAVEELMDVPVDYFVRLDFDAFVDVINAIDGVEVNVPFEFSESNSKDKRDAIHLYPGEQVLNGEEALAFARTRKMDNDLERGKRQQEIIKAIISKTASANSILKYDDIITAVGDNISTNMTFSQMKSFFSYASSGNIDVETLNLTGTDLWTDAYYFQLDEQDLAEKQQILKNHLELEESTEASELDQGPDSTTTQEETY